MKRNLRSLGVVALSLISYSTCFSASSEIIYGFLKASEFSKKTKSPLYIQAGSFSSLFKAHEYRQKLQTKTTHPVSVSHKGKLFSVLVGPMHSLNDLHATALHLTPHQQNVFNAPVETKTSIIAPIPPAQEVQDVPVIKQVSAPEAHEPFFKKPTFMQMPDMTLPDMGGHWFLSASVGEQYPQWANSSSVNNGSGFPAPYNNDLYSLKNQGDPVIGLAAGHRWERDSIWFPAYSGGLAWQYLMQTNVGNTIMQYSDPEFTNYNYNLNVQSNLLLAEAKLNIVQYWKLSPYINGGLGVAINKTSNYSETAYPDVTPRVSPGFIDQTASQLAYHAGVGVDLQFSPQMMFSLGYIYQNLGQVTSGSGTQTWVGQSLNLGSYHSNEVLFSVSYLFGQEGKTK